MRIFCHMRKVVNSLCISMGIVMVGMLGSATAQVITSSGTFGGTFNNATEIDVNADGAQASTFSVEVENTALGNYTCTGIIEEVASDPTEECPGGVIIIDAANSMGYALFTCTWPNGDQTYNRVLTRTDCCDLAGGCVGEDTGETTGGTGQFAGATGSFEQTFTASFQVFDPVSSQGFGSFTGEATGTLDAPNFDAGGGGGGGGPTGFDCNGDGVANGLDIIGAGCDPFT